MHDSLSSMLKTKIKPYNSLFDFDNLKAIESFNFKEMEVIYNSIPEENKSIEAMFYSLEIGKERSEEKFFSKDTFKDIITNIIEKLKVAFAKILVIITNFIKNITNFFASIATKKQVEDYEMYKTLLIQNYDAKKNSLVKGLKPKNMRVFGKPEQIFISLSTFNQSIESIMNEIERRNNILNKYFSNPNKSIISEIIDEFKRMGTAKDLLNVACKGSTNIIGSLSFNDPDVKTFIESIMKTSPDAFDILFKMPHILVSLYCYGKDGFENFDEVLKAGSPKFKRQEQMSIQDFLDNTTIDEFRVLSEANLVKTKNTVNICKSLSNVISKNISRGKLVMQNFELYLKQFEEEEKNSVLKEGFSKASAAISSLTKALYYEKLMNSYVSGVILTYYNYYLKHRNTLTVAMHKIVSDKKQ